MTHEWKAGDLAVVEIHHVDEDGDAWLTAEDAAQCEWFPLSFLHPLPPVQSPEERAVVDACVAAAESGATFPMAVFIAVRALIASRTPPDPLALLTELVAAYDDMASGCVGSVETSMRRQGRFGSALDAVRAVVAK